MVRSTGAVALRRSMTASVDVPAGVAPLSFAASLSMPAVWRWLAAFWAIHLSFWALQPDLARKIVVGDRAGDRLRALDRLMAADGIDAWLATIFRAGSPGDYLLFAPAYAIAGPAGIVVQSLLLYSVALVAVHALGRRVLGDDGAVIATGAWVLLPSTLFHPHVLVTETICNPLLAILTAVLVRLHDSPKPRAGLLIGAALLTAILVFVRHVFLLLPVAIAVWLLIFRPTGLVASHASAVRPIARYLILSFAILVVWWVTLAVGSLRYAPGESVGGLQSNLFLRAERMATLGAMPLPPGYTARKTADGRDTRLMRPGEFAGLAAAHPALFARTASADAFNMMINPGVAMLAGRYLGLFDLAERGHRDLNKWRETREKDGIVGLARLLFATSPVGLALNAIGVVVWSAFLGLTAWGGVVVFRDATREPALRWLLGGLAAYVVGLTSLTAGYTRWDHRTPMDVVLVVLFAAGVLSLARRKRGASRLAVA